MYGDIQVRAVRAKGLTGDRMNLPGNILRDFVESEREFGGICLELRVKKDVDAVDQERCWYGSIHEFTADEGSIQVPDAIFRSIYEHVLPSTDDTLMQHDASGQHDTLMHDNEECNGIACTVAMTTPRKATHITLQPLTDAYTKIPSLKHALESVLRRRFGVVYIGMQIEIELDRSAEDDRAMFVVKDVKPDRVCSLINTDVEVDVSYEGVGISIDVSGNGMLRVNGQMWQADRSLLRRPLTVVDGLASNDGNARVWGECRDGDVVEVECDSGDVFIGEGHGKVALTSCVGFSEFERNVRVIMRGCGYGVLLSGCKDAFHMVIKVTSTIDGSARDIIRTVDSSKSVCDGCGADVAKTELDRHRLFCVCSVEPCAICGIDLTTFTKHTHLHCPICLAIVTNIPRHTFYHHINRQCTCGSNVTLNEAAAHGRVCSRQIIECRYCFMRVERGELSLLGRDRVIGDGLGAHEAECGGRTVDCVKCGKAVKIKDVSVHMLIHKQALVPSNPVKASSKSKDLCLNVNCDGTINKLASNRLGLCARCFEPFFSTVPDPTNLLLKRKIVKVYCAGYTSGCGDLECQNVKCRSGLGESAVDVNVAAVNALVMLKESALFGGGRYWFCVKKKESE